MFHHVFCFPIISNFEINDCIFIRIQYQLTLSTKPQEFFSFTSYIFINPSLDKIFDIKRGNIHRAFQNKTKIVLQENYSNFSLSAPGPSLYEFKVYYNHIVLWKFTDNTIFSLRFLCMSQNTLVFDVRQFD